MRGTAVRRTLLAVLALVAVLGSGALIASAGTTAPKPKQLKVACAQNGTGLLRYVARASQCSRTTERAVPISNDAQIEACVKLHGSRNGVRGSLGQLRRARLAAGSTRLSPPADCPARRQPNEQGIKLPGPKKTWFCAKRSSGAHKAGASPSGYLRWVSKRSKCDKKREFAVFVNKFSGAPAGESVPLGNQPEQPQNKAPKSVDDMAATDEDTASALNVLANDSDDDGDALSIESVDTTGTLGTLTTNANGTITYDPAGKFDDLDPGETAADSFKYKVKDPSGAHSGTAKVDITVTGRNDAPKVSTSALDLIVTEQGPAGTVDSGLNVSDVDSANLTGASVRISAGFQPDDELTFTNQLGITGTYNSGTGVLTLTGTRSVADYQTALRTVKFEHTGDDPVGTRSIAFRVKDPSAESAPASRGAGITPVNDAPNHGVPGTQTTDEDIAKVFTGANAITVADPDARSDELEVELSAGTGTLTLGNTAVLSSVSGDGSPLVTFRGSRADINTALDNLSYQPDFNLSGSDTITIKTDDLGHNGTGGAQDDTDTVDVTINPVNDAPVNTFPDTQTVNEGSSVTVGGNQFSISDPDAAGDQLKTTLSISHGKIDVDPGASLSGNGSGTVELTGTIAQINTSLANVKYTPDTQDDATRTLTMTTDDLGHNPAPSETDTDTVDFAITGINDAPAVTAPAGTQTIDEDNSRTFTGSAISVADIDAGGNDIKATVTAGNGTTGVGSTMSGLVVTGGGTDTLVLTGTRTEVNDALDGLVYTPNLHYNGADMMNVAVDDLGSTGDGGPETDSDSVAFTINAVNDAPVNTLPTDQTLNEDADVTLSNAFSIADVDAGSDDVETELSVDDGVLDVGTTTATVTGDNTDTVSIEGTVTEVNDALDSVKYEPDDHFNGLDTLTMVTDDQGHSPGPALSDTDNRSFTVNAVNDAPLNAVPGPATTDEDTPLVLTGAGAPSVSDLDASSLKVAYTSTHGTLSLDGVSGLTFTTGDGTNDDTMTFTGTISDINDALNGSQFKPAPDYSGLAQIVLTSDDEGATGSGGALIDGDTIEVTVNPVNDKPVVVASAGDTSFQESTTPTPVVIDSGVDISDVDSTQLNRVTVAITDGHQSPTDVLAYTTAHGIQGSYDSGTGVLTLTPEAPATTASVTDFQAAAREVTFSTPSASPGASREITFRARDDGNAESDAVATARKTIAIQNVNDAPAIGDVSGTVAYVEDGPAATLDSDATVTDNDSPNLVGGRVEITNDQAGDLLESTPQGSVSGAYSNGVLTITGSGSLAQYQAFLRSVTYRTTSDQPNTTDRNVEFQVDDGEGTNNLSNVATKTLQVSATNDPTNVTTTAGATTYTEDDPVTTVDSGVTVTDLDHTALDHGRVAITSGHQTGLDFLTFTNPAPAEITASYDSGTGVLTITGASSPANYQALMRSVQFRSDSQNPGSSREITFTAADGPLPGNEDSDTKNLTITSVNDAPVINRPSTATVDEDTDLTFPGTVNVADGDAGTNDVRLTLGATNGTVTLSSLAGLTVVSGSNGSGSIVVDGTITELNDALNGLKYKGNLNYNGPDTLSIDINDQGHSGGAPLSDSESVAITVNPVNDAPTADTDDVDGNNAAHGNTTMVLNDGSDPTAGPGHPKTTVDFDILDGDDDVDGPGPLEVVDVGSDVNASNGSSNDGGTVEFEDDGDIVYHPAPSTSCTDHSDFFKYKITDNGTPEEFAIGTVNIVLEGCVWYVNNNHSGPADNAGTSNAPFNTLDQAETASGAGHTVFVHEGDGSSTGYDTAYAMDANERLIGEHEGLVVDPDAGGSHTADTLQPANPGAHPTLTATDADVIALDDGNEVRGVEINASGTGGGIAGESGDSSGKIDDVRVIDVGAPGQQPALDLSQTSGTFDVSDLTVNSSGALTTPPATASGVRLDRAGTVNFLSTGTIALTTRGAPALDAFGTGPLPTSLGTGSVFDSITVTDSPAGGVKMLNTGGTTTFGDGSGTDLDLSTSSSADPAFSLNTAGTVNTNPAGTDTFHASGGPAISVAGTTIGTDGLQFDDVDSTNSSTNGISLSGLGDKVFSAASGDISGAAAISFSLSGGSGNVTYPGSLGDGDGQAASIAGRTNGTVTLSGPISDDGDAGGGIALSANTGGTTTFTGASKTINSVGQTAVSMTGSPNHTLNLDGGGLDIDTTTGRGLHVASSGTVNVTGTGNSINSTSGIALEIANTNVGANGVTFRDISAGNNTAATDPSSGIVLSNTGTNSALNVTGNGGTCANGNTAGCTGGVIQNTTGADAGLSATPPGTGVVLNNTRAPAFTRMHIHDNSNYGMRGNSVVGLTIADTVINGINGTSALTNDRDAAARFTELTGTVSMTNTDFAGGLWSNLEVINTAGTLNATVTSVDSLAMQNTTGASNTVMFEGIDTAGVNVTFQGGSVNSGRGQMFHYIAGGTGGGTLNLTGNTLHNANALTDQSTGGGGVSAVGGARGASTLNITGNSIRGAKTNALTVIKQRHIGGPNNSMTTTINSNTIGLAGSANSGSSEGDGIEVTGGGQGSATFNITNNNIRQYNSSGIQGVAGLGPVESGQVNFNINGNIVAEPGTNPLITLLQGVRVDSGVDVADTFQTCVDFGPNTITGSSDAANKDFRLTARGNTVLRQPGYAGTSTDDTAFANFAASQIGGGAQGTAARFDSGAYSGTGTTCP